MSAQPSERDDPLAAVKRRLERAARDLESAADDAMSAVSDLTSDEESEDHEDALVDLTAAVKSFHVDNHTGPMRWCTEMCRLADGAA